jgi:hypothetical protein
MTPDYEPALVQFSAENAELERLRIRSEHMELMARAVETLAQSRELLIKADEALARSWPYTSANGPSRTDPALRAAIDISAVKSN